MTAVLSVAMFAVGLYSSYQLRMHLQQREDAELVAAAPTLAASVIKQKQFNDANQATDVPSQIPANTYAVRIVTPKVIDVTPLSGPRPYFGDDASNTVSAEEAKAHGGKPYTATSVDNPSSQWRVVQGVDEETGYPYAVALSMAKTQEVIQQMQVVTIVVSTVTLMAAIALGLFGVRRALRPLRDIEDTAAAIAAGDLSRRVPNPGSRDEVQSLSESLNAMLSQLENLIAVKDRSEESMRRFVADASHELRTPLATVRGYSELYRQGAMVEQDDVTTGFRRIEDEAQRMSDMVDDLLLLSRLEAEQRAQSRTSATAERTRRDVDLRELASDAVADAGARAKTDEEKMRFAVVGRDEDDAHPVIVHGDEQRLRQVVTNLVTNAVRYTPAGTPIQLRVDATHGEAVLQVIDHGPGIAEEVRHRVFDRFYRADVARNRAEGSTGLGLSIVAAIVQGHDGTVRVDETPGGGATFTVTLPLVSPGASTPSAAAQYPALGNDGEPNGEHGRSIR